MDSLIARLRERISAAQFQGETAVREAIVLPVLQSLGWDIFDPSAVVREYTLGSRRVDYALAASPPKKDVFIEVKAVGHSAGADRQLFEYAYHEGIPFAVLTDGREWSFFLPGEQGSYDERRVQKLDLVERPTTDVSSTFHKYLALARVRSGEAIEAARADYRNIAKRNTAKQHILKAWSELVQEPDDLLIDLVAEKAEALCGFRPTTEDVEEFLLTRLSLVQATVLAAVKTTVARPQPRLNPPAPVAPTQPPVAIGGGIPYSVFGVSKNVSKAVDALIDILRTLSERNPQFLETLAPLVRGRSRNHLAQSRDQVYPLKPELSEYTTEFVPGWWLGTNISNRDKMRIIRAACEIEGLTLGREIAVVLPNAPP